MPCQVPARRFEQRSARGSDMSSRQDRPASPVPREVPTLSRRRWLGLPGLLAAGVFAGCTEVTERTTLRLREPDVPAMGVAAPTEDTRSRGVLTRGGAVSSEEYPTYVRIDGSYYRLKPLSFQMSVDSVTYYVANDQLLGQWPVLVVEPIEDESDAVPVEKYESSIVDAITELAGRNMTQKRPLEPELVDSRLLQPPRYEYVTWENRTYRLDIERHRLESADAQLARVVHVASTPEEFTSHIRMETGELLADDGTDDEQSVLREAIEGRYSEEISDAIWSRNAYSQAFQSVLEAVRNNGLEYESTDGPTGSTYLVVYDDTLYLATISKGVIEG